MEKTFYYFSTVAIIVVLFSCSNGLSTKSGLYKSSFPNLSIELQEGGNVFVTPKQGSGNSFYCTTKGYWSEVSKEEVQLTLESNENCGWLNDLNGRWLISECKTFDSNETRCLSKGTWKLVR
ncbi:MAG: hypothetical protein JWP69_2293 [Flaviaesturariibacter sp.]|nr:hypothetical protein [Flaviaesturariibacter sp.]